MQAMLKLLGAFSVATLLLGQTPEADFSNAEHLFRLDNYAKARPYWLKAERGYAARRDFVRATWARVSRLRGDSETVLSYPVVSQEMARLLDTPLVQKHPELRLRCLVVKG
ncbi:MAG TPA: hypothetical protein VN737_11375, partial [Bryobacteraceae bacterium]|nr:hypothetical protein [Bryobacteraceae bacterium]